jgi:hypothetical protein
MSVTADKTLLQIEKLATELQVAYENGTAAVQKEIQL